MTPSSPVRLSVLIPCFEHGEYLEEAVASAEAALAAMPALAGPCELIIIDDGSRQPRTLEVLARLEAAGYRVLRQENQGPGVARNRGLAAAGGRFILPLDADNRLRQGFLERALRVLEEDPEIGVVYSDRWDFGLRTGAVAVPDFDLDRLLRGNFIDACAVLRREALEACGGFDSAMPARGWEDWDLWISLAERGWRFHHLPETGFEYRVLHGSLSENCSREEVGRALQSYVIAKHRDLYLERLPELLIAAQSAERSLAESRAAETRLAAEREALERQRDALAAELQATRDERASLAADRDRLLTRQAEADFLRDRLYLELESWRERAAFMESTTAWKLRERLLRLKGAWRGGSS
jgi:GT2 family glycosyltransferase